MALADKQALRAGTAILLLCCATLLGCASWKKDAESNPLELTKTRLPIDAVIMEFFVIQVAEGEADLEELAWSEIDQQRIELKTRKILAQNGIRCGVSTMQLPLALQTLILHHQEQRETEQPPAETLIGEETVRQRVQIRAGQPAQIVMSPIIPSLSWMVNDDGYLYGRESQQARCQYTVKAHPTGDGQSRVEFIPEITYGAPRQRIGVGNNALMYAVSQDRHVFDSLKIETKLAAGDWLVVGNTQSSLGIGENFFRQSKEDGGKRKLVLIRLAQTQFDNLFAPDEIAAPISTPTD